KNKEVKNRNALAGRKLTGLLTQQFLCGGAEVVYMGFISHPSGFFLKKERIVYPSPRHYINDLRLILTDPEAETTFQDVSELFIMMVMLRHDRAFFKIYMGKHHFLGSNQTTIKYIR